MKRSLIIVASAAFLSLCACGDKSDHKSKSKSDIHSDTNVNIEIETITELHPGNVKEEIALVDPFETLSLSIDNEKSEYPECLDIVLNYGAKDYSEKFDYKAKIILADKKKMKVEVEAVPNEEALEELFGGMKYKIKEDTKEYELAIDSVPACLIDNSVLTNEILESIDKLCRETVDERIKYLIDTEIIAHDHTGDDDYEIVSVYATNGRVEDYISLPMDVDIGYPCFFTGKEIDIHNNRLICLYKSKSNIYYAATVHPVFLQGELLEERCVVLTDTAGLSMQYDSEEEAEEGIKDWLERMCVGYQDGDLVKVANLT